MLRLKMLFPDAPRVIYGENPLVDVICQLRFPPILEISAAEPAAFQGAIRHQYPEYQKEDGGPRAPAGMHLPQEVVAMITKMSAITAEAATYKFKMEDQPREITLTRNWIAISDGGYERWERFREDLDLARSALEDEYRPSFYSRVGLRYKNAINRRQLGLEGVEWGELLKQEFVGTMLASAELRQAVRRIETLALIRIGEVPGGFVTLRHGLVEGSQEGEVEKYFIDADFYTEDREATNDVPATTEQFNQLARRLFRGAITDRLHDALRPVAPD